MINPVPTVTPRRRTPTWLWVLLILFALAVLVTLSVVGWLAQIDGTPAQIVIDGTEVWVFDPSTFSAGQKVALAAGAVVAVLLALIVVPVALVVALLGVAVGLVVGIGVPLALVVLVAALVCSPLLLVIAFGVWLWRRAASPRGQSPANIGA